MSFGKVDCTVHTDLAQRFGIESYPSVLAFQPWAKEGDEPDAVELGDSTTDDIVHAALTELSMIVMQRAREEQLPGAGSDAAAGRKKGLV